MGTLSDDRLSTNIVTKTYLDSNKQKDASQISVGTLSDDRLSTNIVSKTYLESKLLPTEMYLDYSYIINKYNPKFFINAYYWNGLQFQDTPPLPVTFIEDLSGNGLTTTSTTSLGFDGNGKYAFNLNGTNNIISNFEFTTHYTFFWIGQKYGVDGRLFTSFDANTLAFY